MILFLLLDLFKSLSVLDIVIVIVCSLSVSYSSALLSFVPFRKMPCGCSVLGANCHNRHVPQLACPAYLAGFCIRGPDCPLGHPKFETPDEHKLVAARANGMGSGEKNRSHRVGG